MTTNASNIAPATQRLFDELGVKEKEPAIAKDLDKNAFLLLMMEQMKGQNPLNPNSGYQEMAAQMAQYTTVEQLQNLNTSMDSLLKSNSALATNMSQNSLPSMIGKTVKANANSISFDGTNNVQFGYQLPLEAGELKMEIRDQAGRVVRSYEAPRIPTRSGDNSFVWDGTDSAGKKLPSGNYSFVVSGKDRQGVDMTITPSISGKISGVRYKDSGTVVVINGAEVPAGSITEVSM
jgi:flagellar basal-body rod modification protein FlgD